MAFRCQRCTGSKQVMGLGMMLSKCPDCKGTGFEAVVAQENGEKKDVKSKTKNVA